LLETYPVPEEARNLAFLSAVSSSQFGCALHLFKTGVNVNCWSGTLLKENVKKANARAVKFLLICGAEREIGTVNIEELARKGGNEEIIALFERTDLPTYPGMPDAELAAEIGFTL
jgi:histidyl-tRNA synthetase